MSVPTNPATRVANELAMLNENILKLREFIMTNDKFQSLGWQHQSLLHLQLSIMTQYATVLDMRLSLFQRGVQ